MRKLLFLFVCLAAFAISAAALPGCGRNEAAAGPVELTVVSPFNEEDGNRSNFVNAYKAYERETGNKIVDLASASSEEWKARVTKDFAEGREPDVLFYFTGADADHLVGDGKLTTIGDIRKEYPDYAGNMKDSLMPVSTFDGRQYAVPVNGYWEGLFVNKKVLDACGVGYPGADYAWDDFIADCETVKNCGYTPIACSLAEVPHYIFEYAVFNNGNIANHLKIPESSSDEIGRIWAAGLSDIKELYLRGFFPENTATESDSVINMLMVEDKAAFMLDGSWKVGWFRANAGNTDDYMATFVPSKSGRKSTDIIGGLSMGYYITAKAWSDPARRGACVSFITAMTADDVVSSFGALSVTALKNGAKPPEDADSLMLSVISMTKNSTSVVPAVQDLLDSQTRSALFGDVKNIANGLISPEAAIDNCLAFK